MARTVGGILLGAVAAAAVILAHAPASAAPLRAATTVACENGHAYPLVPIAVSDAGDIVTARLYTAPRRGIHVRLIPMGQGYRYAGRGVWLDGIRGDAMLNFSKSVALSCAVSPVAAW